MLHILYLLSILRSCGGYLVFFFCMSSLIISFILFEVKKIQEAQIVKKVFLIR
jgi:hypothetical protein